MGKRSTASWFDVRWSPLRDSKTLDDPLRWKKSRRILVQGMTDPFPEDVDHSSIADAFGVMALAQRHTFLILAEHVRRLAGIVSSLDLGQCLAAVRDDERSVRWGSESLGDRAAALEALSARMGKSRLNWPLPNLRIGLTVVDQAQADERIPSLLEIPAAIRFLSIEPMLGPIDFDESGALGVEYYVPPDQLEHGEDSGSRWSPGVDWVICGGGSGPHARPMHPDWVRSIRDQCQEAEIPFFFHRWGRFAPPDQIEDPVGRRLVYVDSRTGSVTPAISPHGRGCPCDHLRSETEMVDVGKGSSGRLLDGRFWDEFPV